MPRSDGTGKEGRTAKQPKARSRLKKLRGTDIYTSTVMAVDLRKAKRMPPRRQTIPCSLLLRATMEDVFCMLIPRKRIWYAQ
jgi:hypothetical protein